MKSAGAIGPALPLLEEAQDRFEAIEQAKPGRGAEQAALSCLTERGDCLCTLGRLDEAAEVCEEVIRRAERLGAERDVAVGKGQLGTVRLLQRRYPEALALHAEASERFDRLGEPGTVAQYWHQIGRAYQEAGQSEAAEDAYRRSLAIDVQLGNVADQASTLGQLGLLYDDLLDRPEEAVDFLRQAVAIYIAIGNLANEGRVRNNLAIRLRKLGRLDEARLEARRAVECDALFGDAAEPWKTWGVLSDIESDACQPAEADAARAKAIAAYLAYRRDGGENHYDDSRLALAVTQSLLAGDPASATSLLQQFAARPNLPQGFRPFIQSLQSIVTGRRDPSLATAPGLSYIMAAEILLLTETLEAERL
jgi:tetratricopeptide (TPR) repeat protein